MVNYYRDMWMRRSHILAPLNAMNRKGVKWNWTEKEQTAFDNIKRVMAKKRSCTILISTSPLKFTLTLHTTRLVL